MDMLDSQTNLGKPCKYLIFREVISFGLAYGAIKIPPIRILHNNIEIAFRLEQEKELDNVWMIEP